MYTVSYIYNGKTNHASSVYENNNKSSNSPKVVLTLNEGKS